MTSNNSPKSRNQKIEAQAHQVYDLYRSVLLNKKYCGNRLRFYKRWSLALDVILAFRTSALFSSLLIWQSFSGEFIWKCLAVVFAVVAVLKPILNLSNDVEKYARLFTVYTELFYDLKGLAWDIQTNKDFTEQSSDFHKQLRSRYNALAGDDDPVPKRKLIEKYGIEVEGEIPAESLWVPSDVTEPKPA